MGVSWAWWQLLDTACVHLRQRIAHTPARDQPLGRDFRERRQYEGASEQLRMRQREVRLAQNEIVIGDEVDIDRTRAPAAFLAALASERALDRLRPSQKRARREAGFDRDAEIDERRLVFDPPRRGAIVRGADEKAHFFAVAKRGDRAIERVAHVSDIAAERDERFSHGLGGRERW